MCSTARGTITMQDLSVGRIARREQPPRASVSFRLDRPSMIV